jgi:hypothetical protein
MCKQQADHEISERGGLLVVEHFCAEIYITSRDDKCASTHISTLSEQWTSQYRYWRVFNFVWGLVIKIPEQTDGL